MNYACFDIPMLPVSAFRPHPGGSLRLYKDDPTDLLDSVKETFVDPVVDTANELVVDPVKENIVNPVVDVAQDVASTGANAIQQGLSTVEDKFVEPVVTAAENTLQAVADDPIKAAAVAAAIASGQPQLIPYIQGGSALAQGASVEDALLSAGKAYALGQAAGAVSSNLSPEIGQTAANAGGAATVAALTGGDPLVAAMNSGLNAGVNAAVNSGIDAANAPVDTSPSADVASWPVQDMPVDTTATDFYAAPADTTVAPVDTTPWPVQDMPVQTTDTSFYSGDPGTGNAGSFDPETGLYTYNYDDGSSITYDETGNVVDSTESTDTAYVAPGSDIKLPAANFFPTTPTASPATTQTTVDPFATSEPTNLMSSNRPGTTESGMLNPLLFSLAGFQAPKQQAAKDPFSDLALGTSSFNPAPEEPTQSFAQGGLASAHPAGEPEFYSEGGLNNRYIKGEGDGTSDSIPAMVADSEFVMPADVVAALGNGSSDAGASKLDQMVQQIRKRARSTAPDQLPPTAHESPLDYLKGRA